MFKFIVQPDNTSKITKTQTTPVPAQKLSFTRAQINTVYRVTYKNCSFAELSRPSRSQRQKKIPHKSAMFKVCTSKENFFFFFNLQFILTKILLGFSFKRWKMIPSIQWCVVIIYLFTPIHVIAGKLRSGFVWELKNACCPLAHVP